MQIEKELILSGHQNLPDRFILVAEDDLDDQQMLAETFSEVDNSLGLVFVSKGRELINLLNRLPEGTLPCLLVIDYNMPELNGAEILSLLNEDSRFDGMPRVAWSTSGAEVYKKICLQLGAKDYLIKPFKMAELETAARHMLSYC